MVNESEKEKRRISLDNAPLDQPRLGTIEEAYCTIQGKIARWALIGTFFCVGVFIGTFTLYHESAISLADAILWMILSGSAAFIIIMIGIGLAGGPLSSKTPRHRFFIYSNGFIVQKCDKNGAILEQNSICYDDVDSLDIYVVDKKIGHHNTTRDTHHDLKVYAPGAKLLFTLERSNEETTKEIASIAIENSWLAVSRKRAMQEFYSKGYVTFANIKIGRGHFIVDDKDWFEGMKSYTLTTAFVTIFPPDPEHSPYYHKIKNPTGAWAIDISQVNNKRLFLELFNEFFGDLKR